MVMPIAGLFSDSQLGWQGVFYLLGGIGFTWSAIWIMCGLDSPHHHKTITMEELRFIQDGVVTNKHKQEVSESAISDFVDLKKNLLKDLILKIL